jgi:glyoxylase-like metal-dependent hydrolase (beta-lactamase superfamily II)
MTAIREVGKINKDTNLIDVTMWGVPGVTCIYLIKGGKTCLIDGGTSSEARFLIKELEKLSAFPPDIIIITHSHWEHTQAIPRFLKKATQMGKEIEVMASKNAIPLLKDQSWNDIFNAGSCQNIEDVIPLKEGDIIDLNSIILKIFEVPGHTQDSIAILDEKNKNIFVGDALGIKIDDKIYAPAFMPPFCNREAFLKSIDKIKKINYKTLSLPHFGCIKDEEAKTILDEAVSVWDKWWKLFEKNEKRLDDVEYMTNQIKENFLSGVSIEKYGDALLNGVVTWLTLGYKGHKKQFG